MAEVVCNPVRLSQLRASDFCSAGAPAGVLAVTCMMCFKIGHWVVVHAMRKVFAMFMAMVRGGNSHKRDSGMEKKRWLGWGSTGGGDGLR